MPIKKEKLDAINGYREYQARKKERGEQTSGSSPSKKTSNGSAQKKAVVKKEKLDAIRGYREWQANREEIASSTTSKDSFSASRGSRDGYVSSTANRPTEKAWTETENTTPSYGNKYKMYEIVKNVDSYKYKMDDAESRMNDLLKQYGATAENAGDVLAGKYGATKDSAGTYVFGDQDSLDAYTRDMQALSGIANEYNSYVGEYNKWATEAMNYRTSEGVDSEISDLKKQQQDLMVERVMLTNRRNVQDESARLSEIDEQLNDISGKLSELKKERDVLKGEEKQALIDSGEYRDASFLDLTLNSVKQGFYNSIYGEESFKDMLGDKSDKQKYEDILNSDTYKFIPSNRLEEGISGTANLAGQMLRQWSNPRSMAAGTAAAVMTSAAGKAGPQVLVPEEVITVPAAYMIGAQAGSTVSNFEIEAGLAYNEMMDNGISEDTARAIALVVGGGNAALEFLQMDELAKSMKILKNSSATQGAAKRLGQYLLESGLSVGNETLQEIAQEAVTIGGAQAASKLETGDWAYSGGEVADRLKDTAISSTLSFGLSNAPSASINSYGILQNGKIASGVGNKYQVAAEDIINEGLSLGKDTTAYEVAAELKAKMDAGKTVTNEELGRAVYANEQAIQQEQRLERANSTPKADQKSFQQQVKKETGYGDYGVKAISDLVESTGTPLSQLRKRFQTAYEAGMTNMPRAKANLTTDIQRIAFNAGKQDYIMSQKRDVEKSKYATVYGNESGFIRTDAAKGVQQRTIDMLHEVSKDLGIKTRYEEAIVLDDGSEANGSMSTDGIFSISKTSEHPEYVLVAHEGLHRMQQLAPDAYYAFRDFAVQTSQWYEGRLESGVVSGSEVEGLQLKYQQHGMTLQTDEAMDEIAAQFAEKLFSSDEDILKTIREGVNDVDTRNALQKFFDIVKDLARKLKETVSRLKNKGKTEEAAQVQDVVDNLEHARKLWNEAYQASKVAAQEKTRQEGRTASSAQQDTKAAASVKGDGFKTMFKLKDSESDSVKEQLRSHISELNAMDTVANVTVPTSFGKTMADARKWIANQLKSTGYQVDRQGFGVIVFDEKRLNTSLNYMNSKAEIAAYAVLPRVLKRGIEVGRHSDHKGRAYGTVTFAAPVVLNGKRGNMAAVVKMTNQNSYKIHRILMPDGTAYELEETKNAEPTPARGVTKTGSLATPISSADARVTQRSNNVKRQSILDGTASEDFYDSTEKYSLKVTDKDTLDFLNSQETITTYKTMQLVDGKLYPPMASRIEGKFEDYSELGKWEQATEHPELIRNGNKFKLDKGKGQGSLEAAYNPYMHSSNLVINDQFTGAYTRNNLVTVECEVPISEMTSGYHAQYAKDSVGWHSWHTGTVAGQIRKAKGVERQVFLSRWIKPVRIVPDAEVASMYKELLDGTNVEVPDNVVTPSLLAELKKAGVKIKESGRVKYSMNVAESETITNKSGDVVAEYLPDGSAQFSLKTYREDGRSNLKKWLDKRVSSNSISQVDADDIIRQLDEFYDICQKFTGKYAPFSAWSNAEVVRGANGKPVFSVVKANGEYAMNLDFSLVCKKRRTLDAVFREMINRGILDNMELREAQIAGINQIIRDSGFETACALCFVDSKRYRQANVADNFVTQYNDMVKMLIPEGKGIEAHYFDFLDRGMKGQGRALDKVSDKEIGKGILKLKHVMQENKKGTVPYKIAWHLLNNPQDRKLLTRSEFMNTDGFEALNVKNKKILGLYNSSKGSGGPKASLSDVQYLGDILKKNNFTPAKAYAVGGVRIQSFSDYIPRLVFDYLQMTADLTAKKLPAHAYTKEEMFAKQFGMTGIKINMSLVPAVVKDGIAPGLDANGNYVWYDGQSFGSDVNVKGSGQTGFKTAVEIQNAEGYSANCGTIAVGISDEHIWKMLDDPDIRMIIPYHKSSLNHIVAVMNNIDQYNDYTDVQNTRDAKTGTKITGKDFNYNEALRRLGDAKAAANEYLEWCDKNGYLPKFDTFAEHENYYKLLEDFSTYDNGEAAPQGAVTMTFPKSGDAFGSMSELIERGLEEDAILEGRRQSDVPGIVDKIEAAFKTTGDTKFSLKEQDKLMKENAQLKETVEGLREQFKTTKFAQVDKKSLDRFTKQLLKDYQSGAEINDTRDALNDLYTYLANGENGEAPVWNEAYSRAYDVAVSILENASTLDDEMYREYADLRKYLRTVGMTLDRQYSHDLYGYENLNEFRKAYMGRIKLVNDGLPVDAVYQELAARYPEFFDETRDMNPADMLTTIAETLDKLQPVEVNPYSYNMREAATWLANDIMERFYELPQAKPTFADKAETKLTKQVIKDSKKLERLREQKNERIKDIIEKNREKVKTVRAEERVKREEAVQAVKEHYKAKEVRGSENRRAREIRAKIIRHVGDMSEKLLKPTDKQNIPESLRGPVAAMLEAINLESQYTIDQETGKRTKSDDGMPTKRTTAFLALKEEYARIASAQDVDMVIDPSLLGSDAEGIRGSFDAVIAMRDIRLADMNVEQLNTVWSVIRAVEHSISTAGKMLASEKYARTVDWADAFVEDTGTRRAKKSLTKNHAMIDMETPYTFFSHYGEAGHAVYRMLRDAQDQQQVMVNKVAEEVSKIVDSKTVKALEKKTHTFTTERGEKLTLTTAHIMELLELMKREQAQDHLMKGGIVQPEIKSARIRRGTDAILLTAGDLANITKTLTPEQVKIADDLQALTTGLLADFGNEASMKAYGYKKFTGTDYWPIKSAREAVHSNIEKGGNNTRSIKNIGMAKAVMPHANNPLDIAGIFSTFSNHAADMTDYAAWLCPMEDANRLYNFKFKDEAGQQTGKTVKGLLDRVGGAGSQKYWHNLMEDIQNGINAPGDSAMWDIVGKSIGNFKGAAVGANLRVVIQQPTAFFRANAVLSTADLSRGLVSGVTKGSGWKKALQYSPIAMRKNVGGFDISNPYQMNEILFDSRTGVRKLNDALSAPAGAADAVTWGRLWNACEWAVAREHKDLDKGSSEFYSAVNQKFTEVIDQTQVVDGVLQRSQIMRSSNAVVKQATSFMGEPIMSYNLMLRAYDQVRYEQNPKRRGKALKVLGRAATALVVTNVVNALAQSVIDGLRDDDEDKEYWDRFWSAFTGLDGDEESAWDKAVAAVLNGNVGSNMNPLDQIPFVKDALSLFQGYDVNRTELEIMADLIDAGRTVAESIDGTGKKTRAYAIKELFAAGAKAFGIPASNLAREVWSIARSIAVGTDNIPVQYEMEKAIYNLTNDSNKARYYGIMFRALVQGDMTSYQRIRDDLMNQMGLDGVTIDNAMKSRYKKAQAATPGFALSQDVLDRIGTRDREATENDEDRFSDKDLNAAQYQQYSTQRANDYRDIMDDLQQYSSYRSMDAEGRNALEAAAWSYAKETALEDASGGKYQTDTKWIDSAQDADDIGLTVAEYIMLKEQYSDTALRSDGVYDAYDAGIPVDVYLEAHDAMGDIKADKDANGKSISGSRKEKIIDYLNALGLTYEQYLYLLGTEYDTVKKTQDYISFFGSQK